MTLRRQEIGKPRRVHVVETMVAGRWYVWTPCADRRAAWRDMRESRTKHPTQKFRVTPYVAVRP